MFGVNLRIRLSIKHTFLDDHGVEYRHAEETRKYLYCICLEFLPREDIGPRGDLYRCEVVWSRREWVEYQCCPIPCEKTIDLSPWFPFSVGVECTAHLSFNLAPRSVRCKCSIVSASRFFSERQMGSTCRRRDSESEHASRSGDKSVDAKLNDLLQL